MGTYDKYETDADLERKGVWLDLGDCGMFRIARAGGENKSFIRRVTQLTKPYRRQIQSGIMDDALGDKLAATAFGQTVILDWKNVTDENGDELKFSSEAAVKLMLDLPDLFETIREVARDNALYLKAALEEDSKNSQSA